MLGAQPRHIQSWPMSIPVANRDVHVFACEVNMMHRGGYAKVNLRMSLGKVAEPVDQPLSGKIGRRAHSQHARTLPLHETLSLHGDPIKGVAHDGQIIAAGIGDDQPLSLAVEELDAEL